MVMSFEQYDALLERFQKIKVRTFWPSQEQLEEMEKDPDRFLIFCCYLYETGKKPVSEAERENRKRLYRFINRNLELRSDPESGEQTEEFEKCIGSSGE